MPQRFISMVKAIRVTGGLVFTEKNKSLDMVFFSSVFGESNSGG